MEQELSVDREAFNLLVEEVGALEAEADALLEAVSATLRREDGVSARRR